MSDGPPRRSTEAFYATVTPKLLKQWQTCIDKGKSLECKEFFTRLLEDYRLWSEHEASQDTQPATTQTFDSGQAQQPELF